MVPSKSVKKIHFELPLRAERYDMTAAEEVVNEIDEVLAR